MGSIQLSVSNKFKVNCGKNEYILFDGRMRTDTFEFEGDGKDHLISCFPIGQNKLPQSAKIDTKLPEFFGSIYVTKWSDQFYEINFRDFEVKEYKSPKAVMQQEIVDRGIEHTATLFEDTSQRLLIENSYSNMIFDLPCKIESPKINLVPLSFGALLSLTGAVDDKKYLLVIIAHNKYELLWQGTADDFVFSDNNFVVITKQNDMVGRVKRETFSYDYHTNSLKSKNIAFAYENDRDYNKSLVPYLFMEAMLIKDFDKANTYLTEDLKAEEIDAYVGEFVSVECPPKSMDVSTLVIMKKEKKYLIAKKIKFDVKEGKIKNLEF